MSDDSKPRTFVPKAWIDGAIRTQVKLIEDANGVPLSPEEREAVEEQVRASFVRYAEGFAAAAGISLFRAIMGR